MGASSRRAEQVYKLSVRKAVKPPKSRPLRIMRPGCPLPETREVQPAGIGYSVATDRRLGLMAGLAQRRPLATSRHAKGKAPRLGGVCGIRTDAAWHYCLFELLFLFAR
jgi:hypothetical protein